MTAGYVRYEAAAPASDGAHPGLFTLLRLLREGGRLSAADAALAERLVARSYGVHTEPDATWFDTVPRARSWFRSEAVDDPRAPVGLLVRDVLAVLDRYGVAWREVRAADPGRIGYADDVQVVAMPTPAPGARPVEDGRRRAGADADPGGDGRVDGVG